MPSVSSSSRPKVLLSSTVITPSLPTLSMASAMMSPTVVSAAEIDAVAAICSLVSTSFAALPMASTTRSTAASMPFFRLIGFAPAATLRRPSRTSAWARTVAVVVPSPATSSVFLATSLTSSAPIFSNGSSSSISLAMLTPSLVMVGAPHFFSRTTLRPLGPRVTLTASASVFMPRSRPRRASSLKAISFDITRAVPHADESDGRLVARDGRPGLVLPDPSRRRLRTSTSSALSCHSHDESANHSFSTRPRRVQTSSALRSPGEPPPDQPGEGSSVAGQHVEVEPGLGRLELADRETPVGEPHLVDPRVVQRPTEERRGGVDGSPRQLGGLLRHRYGDGGAAVHLVHPDL